MEYVKELTLDVSGNAAGQRVTAKRGDGGSRFLKITLLADGQPLKPEEGVTAVFRCVKPDGKSCLDPAEINEDGTVTAKLTSQVLARAGAVRADISLMKEDSVLSSATFTIQVEDAPATDDPTDSKNEFGLLTEKINEADAAAKKANDAAKTVTDALADLESRIDSLIDGNGVEY